MLILRFADLLFFHFWFIFLTLIGDGVRYSRGALIDTPEGLFAV